MHSNTIYKCIFPPPSGFWLPGPAPILKTEAHLANVTRHHNPGTDQHTITFNITGHVLLSLQLQTRPGVELVHWDISDDGVPHPNVYRQREAYFVMMTHGLSAEPRPVTLTLRSSAAAGETDAPLIDVSLVTLHWEYHQEHTTTFAGLLAKMPDWTFTVPSVASVQSWTF